MRRLLIVLMFLGIGLLGNQQAQAAGVALDEDMQAAVKTAPNGMTLSSLFNTNGIDFSATQLVDGLVTKQSIAQITNDNIQPRAEQIGAFWSQAQGETAAKIDLTQNTRWSFWMYFGNKRTNLSSGMAFVLQNDDEATSAIANAGKGQSLGVWGGDVNGYLSADGLAKRAVQNSWALEFDTTVNNSPSVGAGSYYDHDSIPSQGPHIASGYPAQAATYKQNGTKNRYYYSLNHHRPQLMAHPADGHWRHVTIDWQAKGSRLSYAFNDQDPQTRQTKRPEVKDSLAIDLTKLSPDGRTPAKSATWGITGSTGRRNSANQLVVLDETPRQLRFATSAKTMVLQPTAAKRQLKEGDTVIAGEKLQYDLQAIDERPTQRGSLTTVTALLPTASAIKRLNGEFSQGGATPLYTFNQNELLADRVETRLSQRVFTTAQPNLQFLLNTEVQAMDRDTYVPPRKVVFAGPDHFVEVKSVGYTVKRKLDLQLKNLGEDTLSFEKGEDVELKAQLTNGRRPLTAEMLKESQIQVNVNKMTFTFKQLNGSWQGTQGEFRLKVPNWALKEKTNQIQIEATNRQDKAEPLKVAATQHSGDLAFETVPCHCSFKGELTGAKQMITRDKGWQLQVRDDRGTGSSWKLQLSVSKSFTTTSGNQLSGDMVYCCDGTTKTLGTEPTVIEQQTTKQDDEVTDVAGHWGAKEGVLMAVDGDAVAGEYQGELLWQLTDAP